MVWRALVLSGLLVLVVVGDVSGGAKQLCRHGLGEVHIILGGEDCGPSCGGCGGLAHGAEHGSCEHETFEGDPHWLISMKRLEVHHREASVLDGGWLSDASMRAMALRLECFPATVRPPPWGEDLHRFEEIETIRLLI